MGMGISNDPYAPPLVHTVRQTRMGLQTRYLMGMRAIVGVDEEETVVSDEEYTMTGSGLKKLYTMHDDKDRPN